MAANFSPVFELTPHNSGSQFTSADTTAKKTLLTGGANGTQVDSIFISSNDTTASPIAFYINNGTTDFYIGVVSVPAGSGYTTIARVDGMATLEPTNLKYIRIPAGYILKGACVSTMTATKVMDVLCLGGDLGM